MCIQGFYFNNSNLCFIYFKSLLPAVKFLTNYCLSFLYVGNLKNEKEVLEWLTSPVTMAVTDFIEKVNMAMLERVLERFDYVAVFLCEYRS